MNSVGEIRSGDLSKIMTRNASRYTRGPGGFMGIAGSMMTITVAFVFLFLIVFPQIQNQSCAQNFVVTDPADQLAAQIRGYPLINGTDCAS